MLVHGPTINSVLFTALRQTSLASASLTTMILPTVLFFEIIVWGLEFVQPATHFL